MPNARADGVGNIRLNETLSKGEREKLREEFVKYQQEPAIEQTKSKVMALWNRNVYSPQTQDQITELGEYEG